MTQSQDDLIDSKVSPSQCKLALDALLKHALSHKFKKEQNELLPDKDQFIWLVLTVKKLYGEKKLKPFKIPLKHPLIDPRTTPICLITKDPQREYKDLLESNNIKFISRVVGIQKLKGKFKPFEARRMLLQENGLFMADERVVPLLPKLLGKTFFNAKKQPIPVCLTRKDLKAELEGAVSSTYFHQNQGTCSSIKLGTLGFHDSTQLLNNLKVSLPSIVKNVKGGWDNIQSLHIKTNSSVSLPVWSCDLSSSQGGRWDGLTAIPKTADKQNEGEEAHNDDHGDVGAEDKKEEPVIEMKKGKKRQIVVDEKQQKKKKAKVVEKTPVVQDEAPAKPKNSRSKKTTEALPSASDKIPDDTPSAIPPSSSSPKTTPSEREKKPRPSEPQESASHPDPSTSLSSISAPTTEEPSRKKKPRKKPTRPEPEPKTHTVVPASKPPAPPSPAPAKNKSPSKKTKAVASGIDKKKEKLVTKSVSEGAGKAVKKALLRKKAAAQ